MRRLRILTMEGNSYKTTRLPSIQCVDFRQVITWSWLHRPHQYHNYKASAAKSVYSSPIVSDYISKLSRLTQ